MTGVINFAIIVVVGLTFTLLFIGNPGTWFLRYLLIKPVIDRFAEHGATVGGITLGYHYVAALVIPLMSLFAAIFHKYRSVPVPFRAIIILFIIINVFSFLHQDEHTVFILGYYIRVVFPILLCFTVPLFVQDRSDLKRLVKFTAIAGLFPWLMIILQKLGYIEYNREPEALGSVVYDRATGGYADSFSVALPIMISIFCVLHLLQYEKETGRRSKIWLILLLAYLPSLMLTFHRMTFFIVTVVMLLWIWINRRIGFAIVLGLSIAVSFPVLMVVVPDLYSDIGLFETSERGGTIITPESESQISRQALHGRVGVWEYFLDVYADSSIFEQAFGILMAGRAPHNDYLRILLTNGAVGLVVYLILLTVIGVKLIYVYRDFARIGDAFMKQLALLSIFVFFTYVVSSMTLAVSLLSTMTWYFWVLFGITAHQHWRHESSSLQNTRAGFPASGGTAPSQE